MPENINYKLDLTNSQSLFASMPAEDCVNQQYDNLGPANKVSQLLLILSTPRSGSTYLCDLLRAQGTCNAHEYFQTFQYMQILGHRWQCLHHNKLNKRQYVHALMRYRTTKNGCLGINLHGKHLAVYEEFSHLMGAIDAQYIFIKREDEIAQAVSYAMAAQSGVWSSHFKNNSENLHYDYSLILEKLLSLQKQNTLIQSYLQMKGVDYKVVKYEQLCQQPDRVIQQLNLNLGASHLSIQASLQQSSNINKEWIVKFTTEFWNKSKSKQPGRFDKLRSSIFKS